ncbi:tRNA 2'-phosphotransferase 1 [Ophiocordyceps camponoti-floridani]|uniref:2'-phosphotransferase n=1 Tax=Ophiocordyceps camponoti-floridani TaxID=2030778 RepID=A0A8H4Q1L2_9HYPO|nr:tRNA 2'-phosphotransferase 1 [Ophiocordyceps camponoti-floridani]
MSAAKRDVQVSRALSRLLRHQAESAGIKLDDEGFAPLDQVLAWGPLRSLNVSLQEVQHVVATNDKQRYALKPSSSEASTASEYFIRANQGHSIKLAPTSNHLRPITLETVPPRVLHGTYIAFWPAIEASGAG